MRQVFRQLRQALVYRFIKLVLSDHPPGHLRKTPDDGIFGKGAGF